MWLIKNDKTGKVYKTMFSLKNDRLCNLHGYAFTSAGVLTEAETLSNERCLDKFPYIKVIKRIDGRCKAYKTTPWFTWLCVLEAA